PTPRGPAGCRRADAPAEAAPPPPRRTDSPPSARAECSRSRSGSPGRSIPISDRRRRTPTATPGAPVSSSLVPPSVAQEVAETAPAGFVYPPGTPAGRTITISRPGQQMQIGRIATSTVCRPISCEVAMNQRYAYEVLVSELHQQVHAGLLRPGDRVPAVRRMSRERGVSIATVLQAYRVLEARRVLRARPQSGFYVAAPPPTARPEPGRTRPCSVP